MKKLNAEELLVKYAHGQCNREEQLLVEAGLAADLNKGYQEVPAEETEIAYHHIQQAINRHKLTKPKSQLSKQWLRVAVAAAITFTVIGLYFFNYRNNEHLKQVQDEVVANDILPGKNTATITLANRKTIILSDTKTGVVIEDDKLAYNDGSPVQDSPTGKQQLTATTPRGGTYQVILPDGSKVWLNAASMLKFPSTFDGLKKREVELIGEAYFEIFKNKKQPFVVKSRNQKVIVLGTHFNVNSYPDERSVKTTLLEGSVRITSLDPVTEVAKGDVVLKPNQQAVLTGNDLEVSQANTEEALAWKNGYFLFINEDVKSIMRKISRWYNIDIAYEGQIENKAIWGSVSRFSNVSEVLSMLSATNTVKFKIEGKKIIVLPGRQ